MYSVSPYDPALTYVWTISGGNLISSSSGTAQVVFTESPGEVIAKAYDPVGNLLGFNDLEVTVVENPDPIITSDVDVRCASQLNDDPPCPEPPCNGPDDPDDPKCLLVCHNAEVVFTATGQPGSTYDWSAAAGTIVSSSGNTATVQFSAVGFAQISVEETTPQGCKATTLRCVEVIEKPTADFTIIPATVFVNGSTCNHRELNFQDLSTAGSGTPIVSWQWDFGNGIYSNNPNPSHSYADAGIYTITLTVENECHCTDTYEFDITVDDADPLNVECASVVCQGEEAFYEIAEPNCSYQWEAIGGTITSGDPYNDSRIGITWDNVGPDGIGYISVGCADVCPTSLKIPVLQADGTINGSAEICDGSEQYVYTLPRWPGTLYEWSSTGDIDVFPTDQPNSVVVVYDPQSSNPLPNMLRCTYQNDLIDCGGKASKPLEVASTPTLNGPVVACVNGNASFDLGGSYSGNWTAQGSGGLTLSGSGTTFSPSFTVPGNYIVAVDGSGFCPPDPLGVEVLPTPTQPTEINGEDVVCLGVPYDYTAGPSIPGTTLNWEVVNGSFSNGTPNISGTHATVTFTGSSGPYELRVWREYQADVGCKSTNFTKTVQPEQISVAITGPSVDVCSNALEIYEATYTEGDLYEWSIVPHTAGSIEAGNGGSGIQVLWNDQTSPTTASVELTMRKCGQEFIVDPALQVNIIPSASITLNAPSTICRGEPFTASVTPHITYTTVEWDFGDGTVKTTQSLTQQHIYTALNQSSTTHTITVTVYNPEDCPKPAIRSQVITVNPAPVAFITPSKNKVYCDHQNINETLTATIQNGYGSTIGQQWYHNGTPIAAATGTSYQVSGPASDPSIAGTYYCRVWNAIGCTTQTNKVSLVAVDCSGPPGGNCDPNYDNNITLNATATSCGVEVTAANLPNGWTNPRWTWDQDHATKSSNLVSGNSVVATFTFDKAGQYAIDFTITDSQHPECGYTNTIFVIVPYIADLKHTVTCNGGTYDVTLLDHSNYYPGHQPTHFDFYLVPAGSGFGSPNQSGGSNSYPANGLAPGTYDLKLEINDGIHPPCAVTDQLVLPALPDADFTFDFNGACEKHPIFFTNTSTPTTGVEYKWDFGDMAKSIVENPSRVFNQGKDYHITLTATNEVGCQSSVIKTVTVANNNLMGEVLPPNAIGCAGTPFTLSYSKLPGGVMTPDRYYWQPDSFSIFTHPDDDIAITKSGSYFVTVEEDASKCSFSTKPNVKVEFVSIPDVVITGPTDVCVGEEIRLYGNAGAGNYDYQWTQTAGAGSFSSTDPNVVITDKQPGQYIFELELSLGSPVPCSKIAFFDVTVHGPPAAPSFTYSLLQCEPYSLELGVDNPLSTGTYTWSDGQSGTAIEVNKGGYYSLTYTDPRGCSRHFTDYTPKSPEEYIWIYPLGCYLKCEAEIDGPFDIPDPIIKFDQWGNEGGFGGQSSTRSYPDVVYGFQPGGPVGNYQIDYSLTLNGCTATSQFTDITVKHRCCELSLTRDQMQHQGGSPCSNILQIYSIGNSSGQSITVKLSSDMGTFLPNTLTVPNGGGGPYMVEFFPFAGVTAGSIGYLKAVSEYSVNGEEVRCLFEEALALPTPLCDNDQWKQAAAAGNDDGEGEAELFSLAPNPANQSVEVIYDLADWTASEKGVLEVHDLRGAKIASYPVKDGKGEKTLHIAKWEQSVYFVLLKVNGEVRDYRRLVIQR